MTVVAPGSAQVTVGNRSVGKLALKIWFGLLAAVALLLWRVSASTLIDLTVHSWAVVMFKVLAFALVVPWVLLLIDAWRLGKPPALSRPHRLMMLGATVGLAVLVASPFVVATRYATAAHNAVSELFPSGNVAAESDGRLNILLLGNDAGDGREGVRPDSITLASIDVRTGATSLISLPRNLEQARFQDGTPASDEFPYGFSGDGDPLEYMLNATWTYGVDHPELFPAAKNPGSEAVKQAVAGTLGLDVHYYVTIDLAGFQDLVDSIGGITVRIEDDIPIGQEGRVLEPGLHELDGYEALWYARSRTGTSDYDRMARQRCVLGAFVNEADPKTVLTNFTGLLDASKSVIETDIPAGELSKLVDLAKRAKKSPLSSLQFVPPLITPADPDIDVIHDEVDKLLENSEKTVSPDSGQNAGGGGNAGSASSGGSGGKSDGADDVTSSCSYD